MSQSLPIPAQRWLSLLLCAITAAAITVFLSNVSFVRQAYASWGSILYANSVLHYSFAFLSGIGIKLMLDKFYISHAKRSIGFNWRYPPVTISVLFGLLFIVVYVYVTNNEIEEQLTAYAFVSFKFLSLSFLAAAATIIYQTKLYTEKPIFSVALCAVSAFYLFSAICLVETEQAFWVFFCIAVAYLAISVYLLCEQLKASSAETRVESKQEVELKLESLEDFRKWFKDDSTIKNTEQLEPDLRVYANRIADRLLKRGDQGGDELKGAQHIALCGPFGCGKSSIVDCIANDLAKSPKQDSVWIHSDISTWGAASGSVAHVILSNIIDDISQHIDMCAFRALPKHYTEALKSGGSFFQFASTLLAGPVDIEQSFQKLNNVLKVTNYKLLITLQDVDRGTGDENEKRLNDIAALLDRLKNRDLSNINFIIAMGNENEVAAEVISKATDYREDIHKQNVLVVLRKFIELSINYAIAEGCFVIFEGEILTADKLMRILRGGHDWYFLEQKLIEVENQIYSIRQLKKILRRVNQIWQKDRLMGEINFINLLMVITLREVNLKSFELYTKLEPYNIKALRSHHEYDLKPFILECASVGKEDDYLTRFYIEMLDITADRVLNPAKNHVLDNPDAKWQQDGSFKNQGVGFNNGYTDYLVRVLAERIPQEQVSDQNAIANVIELYELKLNDAKGILLFINRYLGFSDKEVINFERFFGVVDDKFSAIESIGKSIMKRPPLADYGVNCGVEEVLKKLLAESLTIHNLQYLFSSLLDKGSLGANNESSKRVEFLYDFLTFLGVTSGKTGVFSPSSIKGAVRFLANPSNKSAYCLFCLLLLSHRVSMSDELTNDEILEKLNKIKFGSQTLDKILIRPLDKLPTIDTTNLTEFKNVSHLNLETKQLSGRDF